MCSHRTAIMSISIPFFSKSIAIFPFFIILCNISIISNAQTSKENWVPVNTNNSNKIYINTIGLENFKENDIYV